MKKNIFVLIAIIFVFTGQLCAQDLGDFLANVIRSASVDSENNKIYDRIKIHCSYNEKVGGVWAQAVGGEMKYGGNNFLNEYKDMSKAVMAGYDRYVIGSNIMLGIYGRYKEHDMEQDGKNSTAAQKSTGFGIYGGYIEDKWEIKALAIGSYDQYETTRFMQPSAIVANADFTAMTFGADLEGALKFEIIKNVQIKPYVAIEVKNTKYENFEEKGLLPFNREITGDNYLRSAGRGGLGLSYDNKRFDVYINGEAKYLLAGTKPEIITVSAGVSDKARGYSEDVFMYGAAAGASLRIYGGLKIFANGRYYEADNFKNIYGNAGIRYSFCAKEVRKGSWKKKIEKSKKRSDIEAEKTKQNRISNEESYRKRLAEMRARQTAEEEEIRKETSAQEVVEIQPEINIDIKVALEQQKVDVQNIIEKPILEPFGMDIANFDFGKNELSEKAKENIELQAAEIKRFNYKHITIAGYTDSTENSEFDKALSIQRAKAVYYEFANNGILIEIMTYVGFASKMPIDTNKTEQGRAKNRRVEIFVE